MHTITKMEEIRHLLDEMRAIKSRIPDAKGSEYEKLLREWQELVDTLHSKPAAAKYFRRDWLFIKYIDRRSVEVVLTPHAITIETLNGCWLDTIYSGEICTNEEYVDAIVLTIEQEEVCSE